MKKMRNKRINKCLCGFLLLAVIFSGMPAVKPALAKEVKVQIYDTVQGNAEHRSMEMGQEKNNFSVKLSSGNIKSTKWSSSNEKIVTVAVGYNGYVILTAHDEGTAEIRVTVVTDEGQTLTDTCTISVYTKRTKTTAQLKAGADFFRAASIQSVVRRRGKVGQGFTIVASCGNFYRVILPDNYVFEDTLTHQYAYVLKPAVYIPVTEVRLSETSFQLEKKSHKKLSATVMPQMAENKAVEWSSSNKKVAMVTKAGKVTAKGYGTAVIKVKTKDREKTATCKVTVKKKVKKAKKSKKVTVKATNINPNGKYIFRFANDDKSFGLDSEYYMMKRDIEKLVDSLYKARYDEGASRKKIKQRIQKSLEETWEGSCYGMSTIIALNRAKMINAKRHCKANRGQPYTLRYLDLPKNDKRIMSLINYYQISQLYIAKKNIELTKRTCSRLIKNAKKKKLQLFGFCFFEQGAETEEAHEILLKEYVKTKNGFVWISTYDPNSPHRKTYIKVNAKTGKVKCDDYENMYDCDFIDDFVIFNSIKIDSK